MESKKDIAKEICQRFGIEMSHDALLQFAEIVEPLKLIRGNYVVKAGEVCSNYYYVKKGLVLQFYHKNDVSMTENIGHEGDIICCIDSFYKHEPSCLNVTMLEPGVLYAIPKDKLMEIAGRSFSICRLVFAIQEWMLVFQQQKADTLRFESAKDRYLKTRANNPEIIKRAPLHHIASLLQMTPETLSRVRSAINSADQE